MASARAAELRKKLDHPVIDGDGHSLEFAPALDHYLRREGIAGGFAEALGAKSVPLSLEERHRRQQKVDAWWFHPTRNTVDLATATFPGLLYRRLDELGIDYSIVYPSAGLRFAHISDDGLRRAACRAVNAYHAETFEPYGDRLNPVAAIPMHTPDEAVAELEHAVDALGFKAAVFAGHVVRTVPAARDDLQLAEYATWLDFYGIDSVYDYDPVWQRCLELGISPAFHSPGHNWSSRRSVSNFVFNHIGHFASAGEAIAKSLFLGGVTRRFRNLPFAFLEGGVAWATTLYADLVHHWEKRNLESVESCNPALVDRQALEELLNKYGDDILTRVPDLDQKPERIWADYLGEQRREAADDFAACQIESPDDIRRLFDNYYFGCESDDQFVSMAYNTSVNPGGARLKPIFSSDVGHFDVTDMSEVLHEAFEQLEHQWLDQDEFRDFMYTNAYRFYTATNEKFFAGTIIESLGRA